MGWMWGVGGLGDGWKVGWKWGCTSLKRSPLKLSGWNGVDMGEEMEEHVLGMGGGWAGCGLGMGADGYIAITFALRVADLILLVCTIQLIGRAHILYCSRAQ